jgi:hypothetical protein
LVFVFCWWSEVEGAEESTRSGISGAANIERHHVAQHITHQRQRGSLCNQKRLELAKGKVVQLLIRGERAHSGIFTLSKAVSTPPEEHDRGSDRLTKVEAAEMGSRGCERC